MATSSSQDALCPANIINCKLYYGGIFTLTKEEYVGGSCLECSLNISELTLKKVNDMGKKLCNQRSATCFYRIREVGFQALSDDETIEDCRVEGVTHGVIEMYYEGENLQETNVDIDVYDDVNLMSKFEGEVEVSDITLSNISNVDIVSDDNEVEDMCWSEPEEIIDDQEAGSSDEEFIDVQEKKRQWISNRNTSGKNQIIKDREVVVQNQRGKGVKDDYWGLDGDDDGQTEQEEHFYDRESEDVGPRGLSDDEENVEIHENKCQLYNHETPFGSVQIVLGQLYDNAEVLRKALIYYSCQTHKAWNYCLNESKRVLVKCKFNPKCKWKLSARYTKEFGCLQIRFFKDVHTCAPTKINKRANAMFFAEEYQEKLLKHPNWRLKLFMRDVEDTYGVKITRWQASSAKKNALSACAKVVGKQYESLRDYMKGFLNGCRRVLGFDGAFLKGYCKGELLCATSRDANNQMFPVAWAVVESESKESWSWFFEHLINDLDMETGNKWTLLFNQQKGLVPTIAKLLPRAEHRLCARHIFTNWIKVIKGAPLHKLFWKAVKSYTHEGFNEAMSELQQRSSKAHLEMCSRDVTKVCRCFYKRWACTGVTCNNMAETFNSWILEAREKPILTMMEEKRRKVMSRMVEKKVQACKNTGIITPRARTILNDHMQATSNWKTIEAGQNVYEVEHVHNSALTYAVRLAENTCTCRYWDVNGIPCEHATTAICSKNENPESYVSFWYSKEAYETSYAFSLEPLNGQSMWKKIDGTKILPSDPRVKHGRPPNKRKRAYGDVKRKAYTYRIPKTGKQICSSCKVVGHKSRTCKLKVPVDK